MRAQDQRARACCACAREHLHSNLRDWVPEPHETEQPPHCAIESVHCHTLIANERPLRKTVESKIPSPVSATVMLSVLIPTL